MARLAAALTLLTVLATTTPVRAQDSGEDPATEDSVEQPADNGWPIGGALGQRIFCVEGIESNHGRYMYNPQPWAGEHAQGWLGFLPSTARRWGVVIGDRYSEWSGAAAMIQAGAGRQFAGILWGRC